MKRILLLIFVLLGAFSFLSFPTKSLALASPPACGAGKCNNGTECTSPQTCQGAIPGSLCSGTCAIPAPSVCNAAGQSCAQDTPRNPVNGLSCYNTASSGFTGICASTPPAGSGAPGTGVTGPAAAGFSLKDISNFLNSRPGNVPNGGANGLSGIISVILSVLVLIAIILCLFYLIWGGFNWVTSEGDKTRLESARQKVIYAILGLFVVFCSFLIMNLIYYFLFRHLATGVGL